MTIVLSSKELRPQEPLPLTRFSPYFGPLLILISQMVPSFFFQIWPFYRASAIGVFLNWVMRDAWPRGHGAAKKGQIWGKKIMSRAIVVGVTQFKNTPIAPARHKGPDSGGNWRDHLWIKSY
jgi:hypothetical protein